MRSYFDARGFDRQHKATVQEPANSHRYPHWFMPNSEPSRGPNQPNDDTGVRRDDESAPPAPRWVYAFGIIAIVLILAFIISHLAGGGFRSHTMP